MKRFLVLAAVLFLLSAHLVNAQDTPSRIDALMSEYESLAFHGAVLVSVNGEVIYSKAFGFANREWSIPNTTETRFRIGSLTKAFTAALVLRLVEEQILDLHEPITTYLPNYPNPKGGDITLHHLLTHTSGIPSYSEFPEFGTEIAPNPISAKILISLFSERELEFEPGSDRTYSNSGYALAGYIVNKATGMSYAEAMDKWVLIPLGLNDTGVDIGTVVKNKASGYSDTYGGFHPSPYWHPSMAYAAGAMYSTLDDLHHWVVSLASDKLFTQPETFDLMVTPHLRQPAYGYGWRVQVDSTRIPAVYAIHHNGGYAGFGARLEHDISTNSTIIVIENANGNSSWENNGLPVATGFRNPIRRDLRTVRNGGEPNVPRPSIGKLLASVIDTSTVEAAVDLYQHLRETVADSYDFSVFELAILSHHYVINGRPDNAIVLAELNSGFYPNEATAHVGLIDANLAAGDVEQAEILFARMMKLESANRLPQAVVHRLKQALRVVDGSRTK